MKSYNQDNRKGILSRFWRWVTGRAKNHVCSPDVSDSVKSKEKPYQEPPMPIATGSHLFISSFGALVILDYGEHDEPMP